MFSFKQGSMSEEYKALPTTSLASQTITLTISILLLSVTANTTRTGYNFRSKLAELHVLIVLLGMDA